jgi:hypothetical protein
MKRNIINSLLFVLFLLVAGCTEDPEPTLNFREREAVDSLFREETTRLKPVYDSTCTARYDSALAFKVDSMMKVRTEEIQKYLERLRRETAQ